jgi:hypothetical protein
VRNVAHTSALSAVIRGLASDKHPGCVLDAQGTFLFVNEAWDRHAAENGGGRACLGETLIGTPWLDHIVGDDVRARHADLLRRALRSPGPKPRPVLQMAECNTPTTAGLLSTKLEPVFHNGEAVAIRISHTLVRERPIAEVYDVVHRPLEAYRGDEGRVAQCSCCRRVLDPREPDRWDLVPELVAAPPPGVVHALCGYCAQLHVGAEQA